MQLAIYVHPFDLTALEDAGGLGRLTELGFGEVAMATSYHAGRWLQPWNGRVVRFLEDGTVHFRPSDGYDAMVAKASSEVVDGPSPLERLCAQASRQGLSVRAWNVFTHNSRLGREHPELCVRNAFGERYPYALCPANAAVQGYIEAMLRDLAGHQGLGSVELEALGQMGFQHSSHHAKAGFAAKGLLDLALSACFCDACRRRFSDEGLDADHAQARARVVVEQCLRDGDTMAPVKVARSREQLADADREWVDAILQVRARTVAHLADGVVGATPSLRRAVQVHPDPWFTGSQLAMASAAPFPTTDERVLTCYGAGPDAIAAVLAEESVGARGDAPLRLSIWPKAPEFTCDEDLVEIRELCVRHGVGTVAIYHIGLLPWRTIERVAKMLSA